MDLRTSLFGLLLCCCMVYGQDSLEINYVGLGYFSAMSNATLRCQITPIPEDLSGMVISWWLGSPVTSKIARSVLDQNASFVYNSAKPELKPRFSVSSAEFEEGFAEATIREIEISDENTYACDVEVAQLQKRASFEVKVFKLPTMKIVTINKELDIREPAETPTAAAENENDNSTVTADSDSTEADAATETETEPETEAPSDAPTEGPSNPPMSEDGNVTLVHCLAEDVYPLPSKIIFQTVEGGMEWEILPNDYFETQENSDGSFNVTARLRIEPTPDLDGKTIICNSLITDQNYETPSPPSERIIVKHTTSNVILSMFPSNIVSENEDVTIRCEADGNPAPTVKLMTPDGNELDLSDSSHTFEATRASEGRYTCTASNSDADESTNSEVLQVLWMDDPTIKGPADPSNVMVGNYAELKCHAESNGQVSYKWYKDGQELENKNSRKLEFAQLKATDSATYRCQASTSSRTRSAEHTLNVLQGCAPELTTYVAASKETPGTAYVEVTCTAAGNPACTMVLSGFEDNVPTAIDNKATLTLNNLPKQKNYLQFNCTASNSVENGRTAVTIKGDFDKDELTCCDKGDAGGASTGVVIIIVVVAILAVIGVFVACYVIKNRNAKKATLSKEKTMDDAEADKLTAPSEELTIQYEAEHDDFRLNNQKPMRTFSQKQSN